MSRCFAARTRRLASRCRGCGHPARPLDSTWRSARPRAWCCCGPCPIPRPPVRSVTRMTPRSARPWSISRSMPVGHDAALVDTATPCMVAAVFRHRASRYRGVAYACAGRQRRPRRRRATGTHDATRLYQHAKTAGYLYETQLRHELTRQFGVTWKPGCQRLSASLLRQPWVTSGLMLRRSRRQSSAIEEGDHRSRTRRSATYERFHRLQRST